jgi:hypothetical protein
LKIKVVPKLNLKNVENNTDDRDWKGYSLKLEEAVRIQTKRVKDLEIDNDKLSQKLRQE